MAEFIDAFVALDTRKIAYIKAEDLISKKSGRIIMLVEFITNEKSTGRKMEDYEQFPI